MPKKKGKKKKKDAAADGDIEGDGAQLGIGKKKKAKKAKLTKEEKAALALKKKVDAFFDNEKVYKVFIDKMDCWMKKNSENVKNLFRTFDADDEGCISFDTFRAGLHDLLCPITDLEIHILAIKLDPDATGMIDYTDFEYGIHERAPHDEDDVNPDDEEAGMGVDLQPDDFVPEIYSKELDKPATSGVSLQDPFNANFPRFANINVRLATFDAYPNHPCHLELKGVFVNTEISNLIRVIGETSQITSGSMHLYTSKLCKKDEMLPTQYTLQECGFSGGPLVKPVEITLYYDYDVDFSDCPLLNCDFYFGQPKKPKNPVLTAYLR